jgi:hypothetical protein
MLIWNTTPAPAAPAQTNASPTSAQEKNMVDPEVSQQIEAVFMKFGEASTSVTRPLSQLYTRRTRFGWSRGGRRAVWVSKPSRKAMQPCWHRCPANSSARLFRSMQSATTCASSRKIVRERYGRVTKHGSAFVTPILGRSAWNTSIETQHQPQHRLGHWLICCGNRSTGREISYSASV